MTGVSARKRKARRPRAAAKLTQSPWSQLRLHHGPIELLSIDQIHAIHETALVILEEVGMRVLDPKARRHLAAAGCTIDEAAMQVRFDRALVEELVAKAPAKFSLTSRNPERNLELGGRNAIYSSVGGPAFCSDLDRGRRSGTYAEMCDYIKLVQSLNIIHQEGGGGFEALDRPAETRHLDLYYAQISLLDKNWQPWGLGTDCALDALEMVAISLGTTREALVDTPVFSCVINPIHRSSSTFRWRKD